MKFFFKIWGRSGIFESWVRSQIISENWRDKILILKSHLNGPTHGCQVAYHSFLSSLPFSLTPDPPTTPSPSPASLPPTSSSSSLSYSPSSLLLSSFLSLSSFPESISFSLLGLNGLHPKDATLSSYSPKRRPPEVSEGQNHRPQPAGNPDADVWLGSGTWGGQSFKAVDRPPPTIFDGDQEWIHDQLKLLFKIVLSIRDESAQIIDTFFCVESANFLSWS